MSSGPSPSRAVVWYGQLTTRGRLAGTGALLLSAGVLWLLLFLVLPCFVLIALAFAQRGAYGQIEWVFTTDNFTRLAEKDVLLGDTYLYLDTLVRSVVVATVTTIAAIALAYPLAFFIAAQPPHRRYLWLTLVIIPFCTNLVIRTYAWQLILAPQLPPARLAAWLGLIDPGAALYPSLFAVYLGMITSALPFAVLPIYANVERMDWSLVDAARDLYASRLRIVTAAILPQTLPGLWVAAILTFVPAMGMFLVPMLLGGGKWYLVGNLIQQQFTESRDWPFGAAISSMLVVGTLLGLVLVRRRRGQEELA